MNLQIIKLNNKEYYLSNEIFVYDPSFFPGCQTNTRLMITKKKLSNEDYTFGYIKNKEWILSKDTYARSKLLLSSEWVDNNVPKIIINKRKILNEIKNSNVNEENNDDNGIDELYDVPPAPPILNLEDNEMFKDDKGNVLNIEVRGERDHKKCYFKVKDVSEAFGMPNLNSSLLHHTSNHKINIDYYYFNCNNNNKYKKELFLTYQGLLKVLFNFKDNRTKELNIVNNITKHININWLCNKPLKCLYRPDMYIIIDNFAIIIEIDENQHRNYDKIQDKKRTKEIYKEIGKDNLTIIRINPDSYKDDNNEMHDNIVNNINEFNYRMNIIIDIIKETLNNKNKGLNTINLFFDNYKMDDIKNHYDCEYHINKQYERICYIRDNFMNDSLILNLGTKEQKQELASNLIGVHVNVVKQVFNKNISTIPCIYLFSLNKVSKLRKTFNISNEYDDDMIVCKYGCTEDVERRMKEHNSNYGKLNGVNLELLMFSYIEPKFIFEAESSVTDFLNKYKLINDNYNELVIINQKDLKMIKRHYEMVQNSYSGHIKELLIKMQELENKIKIQELQHKNELQEVQHKNDLLMKENEYIKREKELLLKIYELSNK